MEQNEIMKRVFKSGRRTGKYNLSIVFLKWEIEKRLKEIRRKEHQ